MSPSLQVFVYICLANIDNIHHINKKVFLQKTLLSVIAAPLPAVSGRKTNGSSSALLLRAQTELTFCFSHLGRINLIKKHIPGSHHKSISLRDYLNSIQSITQAGSILNRDIGIHICVLNQFLGKVFQTAHF